jgi:hypothetical protein
VTAFCAQAGGDPEFARIQRDAYRDFRSTVTELCAATRGRHRAAEDGDVAEAERLITVVDGVAIQALFDPESWPAERQLAALDAALTDSTARSPTS